MSMDEYLRNEGYVSYIINTNHDELRELKSIQNFSKLNVDGIILLATHLTMAHQKLFADLNIPIVILGQSYKNNVSIIYDDYNAGYDIGKYVADHGHKDILVVGVNSKDEAVGITRKQGIYDALNDMKIDNIQFVESTFSFEPKSNLKFVSVNAKLTLALLPYLTKSCSFISINPVVFDL